MLVVELQTECVCLSLSYRLSVCACRCRPPDDPEPGAADRPALGRAEEARHPLLPALRQHAAGRLGPLRLQQLHPRR